MLPDEPISVPAPLNGSHPGQISATSSPGPSPAALQTHLYTSFLESKTADVTLRVRGSWEAVYRLHRVILIQAGFFHSLFTAGFAESSPKHGSSGQVTDDINIVFNDQNITRAAFEVCIARLYGGGPPLYISPSLIPTASHPLTPGFPTYSLKTEAPPGQHPASARFLLSLLATALYLSLTTTAVQALNLILGSVGPYTVIEYLNFALGKPIKPLSDEEPAAAVGLESIAQLIKEQGSSCVTENTKGETVDTTRSTSLANLKEGSVGTSSISPRSDDGDTYIFEPSFHYGPVSDKIGEASACWLARWGPDLLKFEDKWKCNAETTTASAVNGLPTSSLSANSDIVVPLIWSKGGLNAKWVRALVSSDALFVRGERERYELAKCIVELRRREGLDEAEEQEWRQMFSHGIYYANMSTEDLITISRDISPTTGKVFVPLSVLKTALWSQSVLRHHIISNPIPPKDKELGITETTADILARLSTSHDPDHEQEAKKRYYSIPVDSSSRLGDNGEIEANSMDQLFELLSNAPDTKSPTTSRATTCETTYFGLVPESYTASSCVSSDTTGSRRWSPYPPFRFAVEFWDVNSLKEKTRLYSHTIWYAGSLFNVYIQVIHKHGIQVGVYLHRQSSIDPIPPSSAPSSPQAAAERPQHHVYPGIPASPSPPSVRPQSRNTSRTTSQTSLPSSAMPDSVPAHAPPVTPLQPYRDPRGSIVAYFGISCASATGSSLTRFMSAPDVFPVSQSWGWKSSSLRMEDYLKVEEGRQVSNSLGDVSFRATVVVGIVFCLMMSSVQTSIGLIYRCLKLAVYTKVV